MGRLDRYGLISVKNATGLEGGCSIPFHVPCERHWRVFLSLIGFLGVSMGGKQTLWVQKCSARLSLFKQCEFLQKALLTLSICGGSGNAFLQLY